MERKKIVKTKLRERETGQKFQIKLNENQIKAHNCEQIKRRHN